MAGRPKCPFCGYEDPAFGSHNDRIACGNCGQVYDPEEAAAAGPASTTQPPPPARMPISPPPKQSGQKPRKGFLKDDSRRNASPGCRSDRGDNNDPSGDYAPWPDDA